MIKKLKASRGEKGGKSSDTPNTIVEGKALQPKVASRNPGSLICKEKDCPECERQARKDKEREHQDRGEKLFHELTYDKFKEKKKEAKK